MPELAEVEYYRKLWDPGLRRKVTAVELHPRARIFRGVDLEALTETLTGAPLRSSEGRGKQMLFRFGREGWLGVHLGMSGELRLEPKDYVPQKHDHLTLRQASGVLVFADPRMFGRVRFHRGLEAPDWWSALPPALDSPEFTTAFLRKVLARRRRAPLKGLLLNQEFFPGVGNWMADEILWQSRLHPKLAAGELSTPQVHRLHKTARDVAEISMRTIGVDWGDPPADWLIHVRWKAGGLCPKHKKPLEREQLAGRTTAWCARCQKA